MLLSTIASALFAALVAIGATVAIERFGGVVGGLLGSIPTTIIPASIGFWFTQTEVAGFQAALYTVPVGMMVNALFLYSWRILPPRLPAGSLYTRLLLCCGLSLLVWAVAAAGFLWMLELVPVSRFVSGLVFLSCSIGFGIFACLFNPPAPKGKRTVPLGVLLARGALAALAIGASVMISALGYPFLAGMASVFPAIFLTTMASVWISQGEAVQSGAVGPMMLGGTSVSAYAFFAAWLMPALGVVLGGGMAWILSVACVSFPAWWWLDKRSGRQS